MRCTKSTPYQIRVFAKLRAGSGGLPGFRGDPSPTAPQPRAKDGPANATSRAPDRVLQ